LVRRVTFLLDTHVLLWWLGDSPRLSASHREAIQGGDVVVSAVTVAELEIKASMGKIEIPDDLNDVVEELGFGSLPFNSRHAVALRDLPFHHRDPFDRMLISQAKVDGLTFLTVDEDCRRYDIATR
jgi:PIN domain nuclease of toxin-antitoxin system